VRELEEKRINKEMANIRKKFKGPMHPSYLFSLMLMACYRRKFGRISEEEVSASLSISSTSTTTVQICREDHLHVYPWVQGRCGAHGSGQPHIEFQVQ
jgi:hypothetical protein